MRILTALVSVIALGASTLAAQQPAQPAAQPPAAAPSPAQQLGLSVYAAKQQPHDQQIRDETECLAWAEQQAGIKMPAAPAAATTDKEKGLRGRRDAKKDKKAADQAEAQRQQQVTTLKKPMTSCLQGREYTVN